MTGKVKVKGTAKVGKKLTATPGKAAGATVKYQWLRNGKAIKKATGKTLKLAKSFKGKKISVKVSYVRTGLHDRHADQLGAEDQEVASSTSDRPRRAPASGPVLVCARRGRGMVGLRRP